MSEDKSYKVKFEQRVKFIGKLIKGEIDDEFLFTHPKVAGKLTKKGDSVEIEINIFTDMKVPNLIVKKIIEDSAKQN